MNDQTTAPEDFATLYRRGFSQFGTQALWDMPAVPLTKF